MTLHSDNAPLLIFFIKTSYLFIQLFNLSDTKENQTGSDSSIWNDEEAKFVAKLAQAVNKVQHNPPKTCGIITFYQKQRSTICLELQKMGISVKEDLSRWTRQSSSSDHVDKSKQTVSVKTVDGFQVRIF